MHYNAKLWAIMKIETKLISASCSTKRYKNKQDFSGAMKMIPDLTRYPRTDSTTTEKDTGVCCFIKVEI